MSISWVDITEELPTEEGTYVTLEIPSSMLVFFKEGEYIPASDEINGCYFNGKHFEVVFVGSAYPAEFITHWAAL